MQKVRRSLIERMEVIQDLQGSRPSIVHLFTEIVSTVPNGVYLQTLHQTGGNLTINGEAESNARVSTYMRNLSASEWLKGPQPDRHRDRRHHGKPHQHLYPDGSTNLAQCHRR